MAGSDPGMDSAARAGEVTAPPAVERRLYQLWTRRGQRLAIRSGKPRSSPIRERRGHVAGGAHAAARRQVTTLDHRGRKASPEWTAQVAWARQMTPLAHSGRKPGSGDAG